MATTGFDGRELVREQELPASVQQGQAAENANASLVFDGRTARLERADLRFAQGQLTASGQYDLKTSDFQLQARADKRRLHDAPSPSRARRFVVDDDEEFRLSHLLRRAARHFITRTALGTSASDKCAANFYLARTSGTRKEARRCRLNGCAPL